MCILQKTFFKNKNVWLFGENKLKEDIRYIFADLNIKGDIEDIQKIDGLDKKRDFIVVCVRNRDQICTRLQKKGLYFGKEFCFGEDLFPLLDDYKRDIMRKRKVAVWGTGNAMREFLPVFKKKYQDIKIEVFIDNLNAEKDRKIEGIPVCSPDMLELPEYFVIVAASRENYVQIAKKLKNVNYCYYRDLLNPASELMGKTYFARQYEGVECLRKDNGIRLFQNGDLCICCFAREGCFGNIIDHDFQEIWNSVNAKIVRLSIMNRTFVFCDAGRCPYFHKGTACEQNKQNNLEWQQDYPLSIALDVDNSCNLYCTSCRKERMIEETEFKQVLIDRILEQIVKLPVRIILNNIGEVFVGKYCRQIYQNKEMIAHKHISIYTNGILLNERKLGELLNDYETIDVAVSVDAATESTYKKIRRGGNFGVLLDNLYNIASRKKRGKVKWFQLNYVVQRDNISEMEQFLELAIELHADRICFFQIENWGIYTDEEFCDVSVLRNGDIKEEWKCYFTPRLVSHPIVDMGNLARYLNCSPRYLYMD